MTAAPLPRMTRTAPTRCALALASTLLLLQGCETLKVPAQRQGATVAPRPTAQRPAPVRPAQPVATAAPRTIEAGAPRRYELDLASLVDESQPGEVKGVPLNTLGGHQATPTPLQVLRMGEGYRAQWTQAALPGLESKPPYLKCIYSLTDISRKRIALQVDRSVKFWHLQRPFVAGLAPDRASAAGAELAATLVELQIADVAIASCPETWGEALSLAMGEGVWARVKTRPMPATR